MDFCCMQISGSIFGDCDNWKYNMQWLWLKGGTKVPRAGTSGGETRDTGPNTVQNIRKHKCNVCNETIWIDITITNPGWWLLSYDHRFAAVSQMNYFMKKLNYFQLRNYYKALVVSQKLANSLNNWVANSVGTKLTGSEWVVWQLWGSVVVALWYCDIVVFAAVW